MSIILSGLLWRHSVASVFHCEDLFLHWSSYFPGVNCWSHSIFYGAKYSSHHISSVLPGVNCLSHQIFYGANCSSHHVVSFFTGVNGLSHPSVYGATVQATIIFSFVMGVNCLATLFRTVLTVQVTMFLAFSRVLTVLATLFRTVLTVQVTMFLAFSQVLTVLATLFRTVLIVQATMFLLVMWASATPLFDGANWASVIFLPSGAIIVWGTTILFILLQVYNNYKVLLINYSILKLRLQIFREAVSSFFTLRLHPPMLYWGFVFMIYFEALSS